MIHQARPYLATLPSCVLYLRPYGNASGGTAFKDWSPQACALTSNGNVCNSTSQVYFDPCSIYFDGDGDYIAAADSDAFNIGTNDFAAVFTVYLSSVFSGGYGMLFSEGTTENFFIAVDKIDGTNYKFRYYDTTVGAKVTSITLSLNTWVQLAAIRKSGVLDLYVNGASGFSGAMGTAIDYNALQIGRDPTDVRFNFHGFVAGSALWNGTLGTIPSISDLWPQTRRLIV